MTLKNLTLGNESKFVKEFKNRWNKFRDALRREDQLISDEMFKAPDIHKGACDAMKGYEFETMVMAIMIEQRKIDDGLNERLTETEKTITYVTDESSPIHNA